MIQSLEKDIEKLESRVKRLHEEKKKGFVQKLRERRAAYRPQEKKILKLYEFLIPTIYLVNLYPRRDAVCKDIKKIDAKLQEIGV